MPGLFCCGFRGISYASYKGCAEKALFLYRHPERSRGIFLAHRYSVVCVTAEKGKTFAKGARKSRVQGRFLDCARNDGMGGMGLFHVAYNGYVWKTPFPQRHPERSPRSFSLAVRRRVSDSREWETPYRGKTVGGASYKRLSEGGGERALLLLEMRGGYPRKKC